eukprot:scaffold1340_cov277-Chaetoceros_neogracile.AAC.24
MAKGLRSKCRKASRRQFRNTIGKEDADKKFTIVQSKLEQCISKGGMNSIGRIAQQFHGTSDNSDMEDDDNTVPNIDALGTDLTSLEYSEGTNWFQVDEEEEDEGNWSSESTTNWKKEDFREEEE